MTYWEELHKDAETVFKPYKYRCEQTILTKMDEIPISSVTTKTDYFVERGIDKVKDIAYYFCMEDNMADTFPKQLTPVMQMMNEAEAVKCNVTLQMQPETGKIMRVLDHYTVMDNWEEYKKIIRQKYQFDVNDEAKEGLDNLVEALEKQICDKKLYLDELKSKMMFYVFFDKYLAGGDLRNETYEQDFFSQLFNDIEFRMPVNQTVAKNEADDLVELTRSGTVPKEMAGSYEVEKIYNKKYKPMAKYRFSEYEAAYSSVLKINAEERCLQNAEVQITEGVKNNINLSISFKLRRLE